MAVAAVVLAVLGAGAWAGPPKQDLRDQCLRAYRQADTYQSQVAEVVTEKTLRVTTVTTSDYRVAMDRGRGRLMIDAPDLLLVIDGGMLRLKTPRIPGVHLEVPAPATLDLAAVRALAPVFEPGQFPDVTLLLGQDPLNLLADQPMAAVTVAPATGPTTAALTFDDSRGWRWSIHVDPATGLSPQVIRRHDAVGGGPGTIDMEIAHEQKIMIDRLNQPLPDGLFFFDVSQSQAVNSMQALAAAGSPSGPKADATAPDFTLNTLDGRAVHRASLKQRVQVLFFWAQFDDRGVRMLPAMEALGKRLAAEKLDAVLYSVNCGDPPEVVRKTLQGIKATLPVLLDTDTRVSMSMRVSTVPQTILIADGKIVDITVGPISEVEKTLMARIMQLLAAPNPATQPASKP